MKPEITDSDDANAANAANAAHREWTNANSTHMPINLPNQRFQNMQFNPDGTLSDAGLEAFNALLDQDGGLYSHRKSRRARKSRRSHKSRK